MGLLVEGVWRDEWYDTAATGGKFERPATSYRDWIEAGGRFSPRGRPLSSLRILGLPLGAPNAHLSQVERPR